MALTVAILWTITALVAEFAVKRIGPLVTNIIRMVLSMLLLTATMFVMTGSLTPQYTDLKTWFIFTLSGIVGYVFGDTCLFSAYARIGSRFTQLFMTLAAPSAALAGWLLLDECLSIKCLIGIALTSTGIGISVLNRKRDDEGHNHTNLKLPFSGILLAIGAALGQGVGLVISKMGISNYESLIPENANSISISIPFASTFMRSVAGLIGFSAILFISGEHSKMTRIFHDRKGLLLLLIATITGPFLGVALSLESTRHTSVGIAQTLMALTPVLILLPSYLISRQRVTWIEIVGALLSVVGVAFFFI